MNDPEAAGRVEWKVGGGRAEWKVEEEGGVGGGRERVGMR